MAQGHPTVAAMAAYRHLRLPFARPQTLQTLQILHKSAHLRRQKVLQQAQHAPLPHAQATTRPQQWLKGTPRPQQWLLIGVQGCRLPGLKPSKPSKSKSHHKATAMVEGHHPAAAMAIRASSRRSRLPFARPQAVQTLQKSAQLRRDKVPQQAQHAPLPHAQATTRPQQWLKGTPRPQQWLLIGVQGSPNAPKVRPAPQGKGTPTSPTRATPCHAQRCRQKPPQGHSNGSRAPHGRSNGYKGLL